MFSNITHIIPPYIQFLFVGSHICRQLPSDSASRWTPLLLTNTPYCKACSGLAPYSVIIMSGALKVQTTWCGLLINFVNEYLCKSSESIVFKNEKVYLGGAITHFIAAKLYLKFILTSIRF